MIKAWSFSRYTTWRQCPLKLKLSAIDRINEPPNEAMQRGSEIHLMAERYIKGESDKMPDEIKAFAKTFRRLRRQYKRVTSGLAVEESWAFTKDWDQTMWNDWTKCWVRIKLDCAEFEDENTLIVYDWKTGKLRPDKHSEYLEQLELYALAAFMMYDNIHTVKPRLVYLDEAKMFGDDEHIYTVSDVPALKSAWEKRVKPMMLATSFPPQPSALCRWCFYRKDNAANGGGQCEY